MLGIAKLQIEKVWTSLNTATQLWTEKLLRRWELPHGMDKVHTCKLCTQTGLSALSNGNVQIPSLAHYASWSGMQILQIMPLLFQDVLHESSFTRSMINKWTTGNLAKSVYPCCRLLARYLYLLNQPDMSDAISAETEQTIKEHHKLFSKVFTSQIEQLCV